LSFGGAGGIHACEVAEELGIKRVVFPPHASTLSAWGILWSDIIHDLAATEIAPLSESGAYLSAATQRLAAEADLLLAEDGVRPENRRSKWSLDLRYAGQAFDLSVPLDGTDFSKAGLRAVANRFHALHQQRFSYDEPNTPVELVALRLAAVGRLAKPAEQEQQPAAVAHPPGTRDAWARGGFITTSVYRRESLGVAPVPGPAIIEITYTSSYIPPGWEVRMEKSGAIVAQLVSAN